MSLSCEFSSWDRRTVRHQKIGRNKMTTPNDIATLEAKLDEIEARRLIVNERAAEAAAGLVQARDAHAEHIAAIVAGRASPDAAASPLPDAEFRASIAQQAVQAIEAEHAQTSERLRQAKRAALVAAREADLAAAAQFATEVDAAAAALNDAYARWLAVNAEILTKYDHGTLIGGEFKPYGEAHPGALLASLLHPDVETANRLNIIAPRGRTLMERLAK
jgi:hypothetical protein